MEERGLPRVLQQLEVPDLLTRRLQVLLQWEPKGIFFCVCVSWSCFSFGQGVPPTGGWADRGGSGPWVQLGRQSVKFSFQPVIPLGPIVSPGESQGGFQSS